MLNVYFYLLYLRTYAQTVGVECYKVCKVFGMK